MICVLKAIQCFWLMFLIMCLKIYQLDAAKFWISLASSDKKDHSKLELLTGIDMLLMSENGIRRGI